MVVYLACVNTDQIEDLMRGGDILMSFPYAKNQDISSIKQKTRNFILDSGVFTMIKSGKRFNIENYVDEYADFIKENKVEKYIELDVDQIEGVQRTRELRERLENRVGYPSIPVWHTIRGKESFIQDAKDYNYMALGYFLTEGIPRRITHKYARAFVEEAHKYNCRIHGLGFTDTQLLKTIPFDSVDSSTWCVSRRFGDFFQYYNGELKRICRPKGYRLKKDMVRADFSAWRQYQDYAIKNIYPIWNGVVQEKKQS